jgi:antitoxin component YwqK of YwqJK toxin-antitoxin module
MFKNLKIFLFVLFLVSCNEKEYYYTKTGDLDYTVEHIDKKLSYITAYYKNGQKYEEGHITWNKKERNIRIGLWKMYAENGILEKELNYQPAHKRYYIKFYYSNGIVSEEGFVRFFSKPVKKIGHWKEYYSDGVLQWEGEYENGEIKPYTSSYELKFEICYKNIIRIGDSVRMRPLIPTLHHSKYILTTANNYVLILNKHRDEDKYPYILVRKKPGTLKIVLCLTDSQGHYVPKIGDINYGANYDIPEKTHADAKYVHK